MNFDFSQQPGRFRWNRNPVKTARPLVSIITPFYNSGKHFLQTSYTVLDQTFPFFEWIIVDDGSSEEEYYSAPASDGGDDSGGGYTEPATEPAPAPEPEPVEEDTTTPEGDGDGQ